MKALEEARKELKLLVPVEENLALRYCNRCKTYTLGTVNGNGDFWCSICGEMSLPDISDH